MLFKNGFFVVKSRNNSKQSAKYAIKVKLNNFDQETVNSFFYNFPLHSFQPNSFLEKATNIKVTLIEHNINVLKVNILYKNGYLKKNWVIKFLQVTKLPNTLSRKAKTKVRYNS